MNGIRPRQEVSCLLEVLPVHVGGPDWVWVMAFEKPTPRLMWYLEVSTGSYPSLRSENQGIWMEFSLPAEPIRHHLTPFTTLGQSEANSQVLYMTEGFSVIPLMEVKWDYQRKVAVASIGLLEIWLLPVDDKYTSE